MGGGVGGSSWLIHNILSQVNVVNAKESFTADDASTVTCIATCMNLLAFNSVKLLAKQIIIHYENMTFSPHFC